MKTIMRFMKKLSEKTIAGMLGKENCQKFFEYMYFKSLHGMNIGLGGNYATSGEKRVLEIIFSKLKDIDNITVFDVGANVGHYSNMVNEIFGNKVKIFAFEPSKATFEKMVENTNGLKNISRYNFGFGNTLTETKLYTDTDGSGLASVYKRNLQHFNISMDQEEVIKMRTIDDFCSKNGGGGGYYKYTFSKLM
jgi:FkbM family methyltransferase